MDADATGRAGFDARLVLNGDRIRSARDGGGRCFDETLAEDSLCPDPDGSLVGKAGHSRGPHGR